MTEKETHFVITGDIPTFQNPERALKEILQDAKQTLQKVDSFYLRTCEFCNMKDFIILKTTLEQEGIAIEPLSYNEEFDEICFDIKRISK